jgi:serine/threonine protein kinase
MWALGVIAFLMLRGKMPFSGDNGSQTDLFKKVVIGNINLSDERWSNVSFECKDLVKGLLNIKENERLTVDQALNHPWVYRHLIIINTYLKFSFEC